MSQGAVAAQRNPDQNWGTEGAGDAGCAPVLSAAERGALLGVIDAAVEIRTLNHLWRWSRSALQRILPHGMFACGTGNRRLTLRPILFGHIPTALPHKAAMA